MRLTTVVIGLKTERRLVDESDCLNVAWGLCELHTLNGTRRYDTRAVLGSGTVSNELLFVLGNCHIREGRAPDLYCIENLKGQLTSSASSSCMDSRRNPRPS